MLAEEDPVPARDAAPVLPNQGNQPSVSKPQGVARDLSLTCTT